MPGIDFVALALSGLGEALVGGGEVAARLPLADRPITLGGVLADIVILRAGEDQLHDLVDAAIGDDSVDLGHGCFSLGRLKPGNTPPARIYGSRRGEVGPRRRARARPAALAAP